ncbi:MAG: GNAT family N-acetyltransferase [Undibacterium sp.]|nr:GNAT family N-acetyltransferase [Undibacterium sp.]
MSVSVKLVHPSDAAAVLAFELANRQHFEQYIATRGDNYYHLAHVKTSLEQAYAAAHLAQQKEYHYLAWLGEQVVGRVALRAVEREQYFKASVGYRFSAQHQGKGYASAALNYVAQQAFEHLHLHRLEAVVIASNGASQQVLRKCGFTQYGHAHSAVLQNKEWCDLYLFERLNE